MKTMMHALVITGVVLVAGCQNPAADMKALQEKASADSLTIVQQSQELDSLKAELMRSMEKIQALQAAQAETEAKAATDPAATQ